ncbi:DUF4038 domain-containing protein [Ulvibacterium sp.]|uniref:apiosidase-like domain-containing protein n=1 Tax=Ulvibacterium sp. TaxID=2665914 RepID=UPI003CC557C1
MKIFIRITLVALGILNTYSQDEGSLLELKVRNCITLKVSEDATNFNWISGNQDIAYVDENGVVCGINTGRTSISAVSKESKQNYLFNISIISNQKPQIEKEKSNTVEQNTICRESKIVLDKILKKHNKKSTDPRIGISKNGRYLVFNENDKPVVFISQTLWSMTRRLTRKQIIEILDICVDQGFTAIQLIAHSHYMGENMYGDTPFKNEDFLCPILTEGNDCGNELQYDWWDHLEFIIEECIKRELLVCLLPTWREQWNQKTNLNKHNAFTYGKFIGSRYRHLNEWIIWVMGGDAAPNDENKLMIQRELAKGIAYGVNNIEAYDNLMMSYHTFGPSMTNLYFPVDEDFMDFNTIQSGQSLNRLKGMIEKSWKTQHKPTIDFEPFYDKNGELQNETRTTIISGIFRGGFGTSYGCWNIWHCGARNDIAKFSIPESLENSYGAHIKHLKRIITPHFIEYRIPDQDVLLNNTTLDDKRILANTSIDGSFIYVYSPKGEPFTVNLDYIKGNRIVSKWFNPTNGQIQFLDLAEKETGQRKFSPPSNGALHSGNDWILIIEKK